jgi:copper transport protein
MKTRLVPALAALAVVLAGAVPASAHAYILLATPAAGATLTAAPATVRIQFDEPIALPDGPAITVVDAAGKRVDKNDVIVDPDDATAVVVHLAPLARGSYEVRWRVVSADTHVVHGTYAFGYGVAAAGTAAAESTLFDPSAPLASVLRWLALAGIAGAAGALAFGTLLRRGDAPEFGRAAERQARYGSALALVATVALFAVQSAASAGALTAGLAAPALTSTLHSPFGIAALIRVLALAVIFFAGPARAPVLRGIAGAGAAVAFATFTFSGHATAAPAFGLTSTLELTDWLHLAAVSAWIGGLGVLATGLAAAHADLIDSERRAWLARFTVVAAPCVLLTIATGAYATLAHEDHIALLLTTNWGVVLAIKIALVAVLLALGAAHLQAGRGIGRYGRRTLFVEVVLAAVILLATGVLVGQSPPACMFMPPGSVMPPNAKMPPGMQMC